MVETRTTIELQAPPERVWAVLTDFGGYERWHPLLRVSGVATLGGPIRYSRRMSLQSARWITADADIVELEAPTRLAWRIGSGRLFATDESFEVEATADGARLTHVMKNSGVLAALTAPISKRKNKASMELFDGLLARRLTPASRKTRRASTSRNKRHGTGRRR